MEKVTTLKDALLRIEQLEEMFKSPYFDSFDACRSTVKKWNKQIRENEVNLFDPEDKQKFDMIHKYLTEQKPYLEQLDFLLSKMTPEEKGEAERKMIAEAGTAEHLALKHKRNGTSS